MIVRNDNTYRHTASKSAFGAHGIRRFQRIRIFLLNALMAMYVAVALGAIATPAIAAPPADIIQLDGPIAGSALHGKIAFYLDADWQESPASMAGPNARLFQPLLTNMPDFGYTKSIIWLRLKLHNTAKNQSKWLLYFRENFKQVFEVHVVYADGRIETPLRQDRSTGFATRPIAYPELVAPLMIDKGEAVTILIRYWSEGASYLPVQIETPTSFSAISALRTAKNFLYYGMMALLLVTATVALAIFRHGVFLAYIAYSSSTLLFLMHADGIAFQYVWPQFPGFNSVASVFTGSGIILSGAVYTRIFLRTRLLHPIIDKLLLLVIFGILTIDIASFFLDNQPIKRLLVLTALSATLLFTIAGLVAARKRFKEVRFFIFAWGGAVLSAFLMTARHWLGVEVSQDFQYDSMRVVMVFDATMMGLAIIDGYNQLRRSRQAALRSSLSQAQRNLDLSARLQELEQQFSLADELARTRDDALQDTIHDLRQPLHALRLRIHTLLQDSAEHGANRAEIEGSFRYLETLVNERLHTGEGANSNAAAYAQSEAGIELNDILLSIHQMFLPDAFAKGLNFRLCETSATIAAAPLPLMRVLSNLVANAIKYTESGSVLLGVRRAGASLRIEVHDTGPGMAMADFERAQGRTVRLDTTASQAEGQGLGLGIASQIAETEGWKLSLAPSRTTGAGVILTVAMEAAYLNQRRPK